MPKKTILKNNITNYIIDKDNCAPCQLKENQKSKKFKSCYSKDSLLKIASMWNKNNSKNKIKIENQSKKKYGIKFKKI